MARQLRVFADSIYGLLPYSVKLNWGLRLAKEEGYHPLKSTPYMVATITSLDNVWRGKVYREQGRVRAVWTDPRTTDRTVALNWTPFEGWTVHGNESGRRTRPLPKFIAAILCATLTRLPQLARDFVKFRRDLEHKYLFGMSSFGLGSKSRFAGRRFVTPNAVACGSSQHPLALSGGS